MNYSCTDYRAEIACERSRLSDEDFNMTEDKCCPVCQSENPELFYLSDDDECVGCSECVTSVEWGSY